MPRPLRPCAVPGCPTLVARGRCAEHTKPRVRDYNHGGGSNPRWRALRAHVLARDPVCVLCHRAPSTVAEHRIPKRNGGKDDLTNLQGTCGPCASAKTARQDGGFGNPKHGDGEPSAKAPTPRSVWRFA